ncbi:hypothetical protein ACIBK9_31270 [Nonomuraea sp. NPDC050227]|uniref:hypothetical protein n=1 Tax=Nonomuraea sp. NPDC050227 TaxID=3364360 RepID=UPI003799A38F
MPRDKVLCAMALLLTAGFVAFVLLAPATLARPVSQAVLGSILCGVVAVIARKVFLARRSTGRNQPPA